MRRKDFVDLFNSETSFWWYVGMERILVSLFKLSTTAEYLNVALDAGCGTGRNLELLKESYAIETLVGLDYSKDALEFAGTRKVGRLINGSTLKLPFPDETFDLITSLDVLVHLPEKKDPENAILEISRVLKPEGHLFLRAAAYSWLRSKHDIAIDSYHRFTVKELETFARRANLEVVFSSYANTFLFPLAVLTRMLGNLSRSEAESEVKPPSKAFMPINRVFTVVLKFEAFLIKKGFRFPFGLSAILILKKKAS